MINCIRPHVCLVRWHKRLISGGKRIRCGRSGNRAANGHLPGVGYKSRKQLLLGHRFDQRPLKAAAESRRAHRGATVGRRAAALVSPVTGAGHVNRRGVLRCVWVYATTRLPAAAGILHAGDVAASARRAPRLLTCCSQLQRFLTRQSPRRRGALTCACGYS